MMQVTGWIRSVVVTTAAAALIGLAAVAGWEAVRAQSASHSMHSHSPAADQGGWLARLSPSARVAAIERQLRGFETTMAEVSYRYSEMYFGALHGNWGYAEHMAHGLGSAITLGLERRPQYRSSADVIFFKVAYPQLLESIKAKDLKLFKQRIEGLRAACTACHAAEAHPFIKIGVPTVRHNPVASE